MKTCYRYFGGFLDTQEKWLNKMAKQGYRLVKTDKISYTFEPAKPSEYQYAVEFVAHQSYTKGKDYKQFLENLGYRVFFKNINLNYSVGKIKWRPFAQASGQIATNPGAYNRELLIVEKLNNGQSFDLHTTNRDKASYFQKLRNMWLVLVICLLALAGWFYYKNLGWPTAVISLLIVALICAVPTVFYQKTFKRYSDKAKLEE